MSSHIPALRATALQAADALARYELHVRRLAATWLDMELYRTVSTEIDEIQRYCKGLPQFSVAWVALLISHAELIHCLWRSSQPGSAVPWKERQHCLLDHIACIHVLADRCIDLARQQHDAPCSQY
jgi:hypothetical protein